MGLGFKTLPGTNMTQDRSVDFHLYLTGQGQPGDRHVGVQHLELGLQRESHTEKKRESERNKSKFSKRKPTLCAWAPESYLWKWNHCCHLGRFYSMLKCNNVLTIRHYWDNSHVLDSKPEKIDPKEYSEIASNRRNKLVKPNLRARCCSLGRW